MLKMFKGQVSCQAAASALVFVRAENAKEAATSILNTDPNFPYQWKLDESYQPENIYFMNGSGLDVSEVQFQSLEPFSLAEWNTLNGDALLCWQENTLQPYTKSLFVSLAQGNDNWAFKLYDAYIRSDSKLSPEAYLNQTGLDVIVFGVETNIQRLFRILGKSACVMVNSGPLLTNWDSSEILEEPDNEVLTFSAVDDDGNHYSSTLTEEAINNGEWVDDMFVCDDVNGDETDIQFFKLTSILSSGK